MAAISISDHTEDTSVANYIKLRQPRTCDNLLLAIIRDSARTPTMTDSKSDTIPLIPTPMKAMDNKMDQTIKSQSWNMTAT